MGSEMATQGTLRHDWSSPHLFTLLTKPANTAELRGTGTASGKRSSALLSGAGGIERCRHFVLRLAFSI